MRLGPAGPALAIVAICLAAAGCKDEDPGQDVDLDASPAERATGLAGSTIGLAVHTRQRYVLGSPTWTELEITSPFGTTGMAGLWLRTRTARVSVDGNDLPPRPWNMGRSLAVAEPIRLDLGTLVGGAVESKGAHTVVVALESEIVDRTGGKSGPDAPVLWTGTLKAAQARFEVVAARIEDIVSPVRSPQADPTQELSIHVHVGGQRTQVWPRPEQVRRIGLIAAPQRASLWIASGNKLSVGLAYEVYPAAPDDAAQASIGQLVATPDEVTGTPRLAGVLDLTGMDWSAPVSLQLRFVPSPQVAYRKPGIASYWDGPLVVAPVEIAVVEAQR